MSHRRARLAVFLLLFAGWVALMSLNPRSLGAPMPAHASVDLDGTALDGATFKIHVFFSDRSGSLYCFGANVLINDDTEEHTRVVCELTPEGRVE